MKRIISVISTILVLTASVSAGAFSTENFINGDVDRNGEVDISDATTIQKYLASLVDFNKEQEILSDTDLDERVSIMDVTKIQRALVGIGELSNERTDLDVHYIDDVVNIYFTNNLKWTNVYFYLYNAKTGEAETAWPGKAVERSEIDSDGRAVHSCAVDTSKYDRVIFTNGDNRQTINIPVNKSSSGFMIKGGNSKAMLVNTYAYTGSRAGKTVTTTLTYSEGYEKKIWIWTPADYSPASAQKYKTIYMTDGQNLFEDNRDGYGGWQVINGVESMMANGGRGVILVGIDNSKKRDNELTPNLGEVSKQASGYGDYHNGSGEAFSNFVVDKVMPYVQKNFNSSTEACDNFVVGSSSGGLESFYIGMENKDKFSGIGALSPAFVIFESPVWNEYLSKYNFSEKDMPKLYLFNGKGDALENSLYPSASQMYNRLLEAGYSKEKITFVIEDNFAHNENYWRVIFPEVISWLMDL